MTKMATAEQFQKLDKDQLIALADDVEIENAAEMTAKQLAAALVGAGADLPDGFDDEDGGEEEESTSIAASDGEVEVQGNVDDYRAMADQTVHNIREIRERDNELFVELATELNKVKKHNLYLYTENPSTGQTYKSMKEYLQNEVAYSERKAHYLTDIYDKFEEELGVLDKVKSVGWTKLKELVDVVNKDNYEDWYEHAQENSVRDLQKLVKEEKIRLGLVDIPSPEGLETEQTKRVPLSFFPDQLNNFNQALAMAREVQDTDNKSELVNLICLDFIASNQELASADVGMEALLHKMEEQLGVRMVVFQDDEMVYGKDTLDSISNQYEEEEAAEEDIDDAF
jgi:hypothetical protein